MFQEQISSGDNFVANKTRKGSITPTNVTDHDTKPVIPVSKTHCSVPARDVHCSVTNNIEDCDPYTKQVVQFQIGQKLYSQQQKRINMHITPRRPIEHFPFEQTGLKVNRKHFHEKHMTVDEIDIESLQHPMRASTPMPSIPESTIVAGHLNFSTDEVETRIQSTDDISSDSEEVEDIQREKEMDEIFAPYMQKIKRNSHSTGHKSENVTPITDATSYNESTMQNKNKCCKDWMQKEEGVSTNNYDAPPSLYAPSVALSDSLLDMTSVSRNVSPMTVDKDIKKSPDKGRAIGGKDYSNTFFM